MPDQRVCGGDRDCAALPGQYCVCRECRVGGRKSFSGFLGKFYEEVEEPGNKVSGPFWTWNSGSCRRSGIVWTWQLFPIWKRRDSSSFVSEAGGRLGSGKYSLIFGTSVFESSVFQNGIPVCGSRAVSIICAVFDRTGRRKMDVFSMYMERQRGHVGVKLCISARGGKNLHRRSKKSGDDLPVALASDLCDNRNMVSLL